MSRLIELSDEIQSMIAKIKALDEECLRYKQQLVIIGLNNGGKLRNLDYPNLNDIDWSKVSVGIGFDTMSIVTADLRTPTLIKSFDDLPLLK